MILVGGLGIARCAILLGGSNGGGGMEWQREMECWGGWGVRPGGGAGGGGRLWGGGLGSMEGRNRCQMGGEAGWLERSRQGVG